MKEQCFEFRSRLSSVLEGFPHGEGPGDRELQEREMQTLGWHEHLLHCSECRQLLESEQILEELLGSLPEPSLSAPQRASLVLRLAENLRLERLLDEADLFHGAPAGLSERVLQGVRRRAQGGASEPVAELLDQRLAELETVSIPSGLSERVLQYCQKQGSLPQVEWKPKPARPAHTRSRGVPLLRHWLTTGLVAASLAAFLWYLPGKPKSDSEPPKNLATNSDPVESPADDADVLALLDSLEVMDLVDELNAEEWELVGQYDSYALFLVEDQTSTDGEAR